MGLRHIFDGAQSLAAAVVTVGLTGVPLWYTHQAIQIGLAPQWVYAVLAALFFVSASIVFAFLAKMLRGVAPLRERRR
ncbi:hypothetical protein [Pseudaestuariivita atlantica]|uniref:Uncharacterized protein n=1 Tax=Pseudaestuariivita atlantica TaxID=1317121 RepID=A0A0L1JM70_9RHOB|nr:hypothetical protein [Pseudaestuariivita atlantica]KNG92483.1 hypothetical protein ATO11_17925 [Pseudaestuariivita atlantica]